MRKSGWSIAFVCLATLIPATAHAQDAKPRARVGLYYFDGWSGKSHHVTKLMETEYADRKPVWGWYDDTVEIMQKQTVRTTASPSGPSIGTTQRARTRMCQRTTPWDCISRPLTASD